MIPPWNSPLKAGMKVLIIQGPHCGEEVIILTKPMWDEAHDCYSLRIRVSNGSEESWVHRGVDRFGGSYFEIPSASLEEEFFSRVAPAG